MIAVDWLTRGMIQTDYFRRQVSDISHLTITNRQRYGVGLDSTRRTKSVVRLGVLRIAWRKLSAVPEFPVNSFPYANSVLTQLFLDVMEDL